MALLALFVAGCASATPPQPQVAATQPAAPEPTAPEPAAAKPADKPVAVATPEPVATPVAVEPVRSRPAATPATTPAVAPPAPPPARAAAAPPTVRTPAPQAARAGAAPAVAAPKPATPAVAAPRAAAAAPTLDIEGLKARLRATKAIGVFTKLSLKNKVDDLMKQFTDHYQGKKPPIAELRQSYNLLMMKVLTLLQDADPPLAMAVVASREAIWALLANEKTFAALQV